MPQLMNNADVPPELRWQSGNILPVKREEFENSSDEEHCSLNNKRSKISSSLQQQGLGACGFPVSPSQFGLVDEPSPLGLRLRKSPSLLDLIQMRLSKGSTSKVGSQGEGAERKHRNDGKAQGLEFSCFSSENWELGVLDGGLKNKIEIQWSDIMGLKANYPDDVPGTLDVVLARQPLFFRETNPQPRKHTLWQATSDFTEGQASIHRRHYLVCPQGLLGKHFEKLVQCDPRLNFLSQQAEITLDSPYFESRISVFEDTHVSDREFDLNNEGSPHFLDLQSATSPSGAQCSSSKSEQDPVGRPSERTHHENPSPSSVIDTGVSEDMKSREVEQWKGLSNLNQLRMPGIHPSVSMSDLVSQLEQRVSEQKASKVINLASNERQSLEILEELSKSLLSDTQNVSASDEKSLMSRVNSLCCLLQKDPATAQKSENRDDVATGERRVDEINFIPTAPFGGEVKEDPSTPEDESNDLSVCKPDSTMSRKDSVGDLLLNLPRIASLPQFLFMCDDSAGNQAR
ncbi:hypothetical protein RND71_006189 [Anisodus tanguticus]|uniref:TRF2/HOY1 PH-like domain-containing protein n=1 Tax=Anisodus tanguticus TaxID=243964 RepID=A0AAE1SUJ1_9SOLA|nr:hypothetical protein RND71_006189 [Anisodus tanguticus]